MPSTTTAADIMRKKLVTVTRDTSVMDAVGLLMKHSISGAPVVEDGNRLVGVLSELDCMNHLLHCVMQGAPTGWVEDLMTRKLEMVPPDATLLTVAHLFNERGVRRIPVVDEEGRLLGQISRRDLMKALYLMSKPENKSKPKPLFLSAIYSTEDLPAKLDPSSKG